MSDIERANAACFILIHTAQESGAEEMAIKQSGVYHKEEMIGDWEIIVRKV